VENHKHVVLGWAAQAFVERMVRMGKPEAWKSPYILRGPMNFTTKKAYRGGMNAFFLSMTGEQWFAGASQAKKVGLSLPPNARIEHGVTILVPILGYITKKDENGKKETFTYVKSFSSCVVYPLSCFLGDVDTVRKALEDEFGGGEDEHAPDYHQLEVDLSEKLGIPIQHREQGVAYSRTDILLVNMPDLSNLKGTYTAIRVLFHEVGHALKFHGGNAMDNRGMEEAVAELFSMFAAGDAGYPIDMENTMAYLWSWLDIPDDAFPAEKGFRKFDELEPLERTIVKMVQTAMAEAQNRLSVMNKLIREFEEAKVTA
jgi:hypothetical protein